MHIPPFDNKNIPIVDIDDSRVPLNYLNIVNLKKDQLFEFKIPGYETCIVTATGTIDINIEDNLSGFAGGFTSQQTIVKLAKFNAILCFQLEEVFDMEVHNINPMTARKNVFGKARVKGIKAKDLVKMKIEEMYNTKKWCKETTRGNWDKRNIDMYDGLVMSLFEEKA